MSFWIYLSIAFFISNNFALKNLEELSNANRSSIFDKRAQSQNPSYINDSTMIANMFKNENTDELNATRGIKYIKLL